MKKTIAAATAALGLLIGGVVAAAPASADATYSCSTDSGHLIGSATRINYGNNKSAINAYATARHQHDVSLSYDIVYTFSKFTSSSGLQTRTTNPTQWGSTTNPLDLTTRYVTVYWAGHTTAGQAVAGKSCTIRVGG